LASIFENARHARGLASAIDAFAVVPLLRAGLALGLAEGLRTAQEPVALAERLGLAPDLVTAWARMLHAQGWLVKRGDAYRLAPPFQWLVDAPEAAGLNALLEQAVDTIGPRLASLPELMKGAERPLFGGHGEASAMAAITRLMAPRALRALERIPGARRPERILDVGCGQGYYLADLLSRFRDSLGMGVEIEPRVAEAARRRLAETGVQRRAEIRVGDFLTMEPPPGRFDLVLLNHDLHYFAPAQRVALLRRARGLLDDRGVVAVQTLVLTEGLLPGLLGLQGGAALFDLVLRCHRNLHGLPAVEDVHRALREAGLARTGEESVVPGGAVRYVWGSVEAGS
jgi:SAM-dependent methyltransferase